MKDKILVALDVETRDAALALADTLRGSVGGFKIGSRLFTAEGPSMVRALTERGDRVFLDLKFHDIPNTVATAVAAATELGVWMLNVHAGGGTRDDAGGARRRRTTRRRSAARAPPLVIAVTVLTSMNQATLREIGVVIDLMDQVLRLAELTKEAGLDGVVASPQETRGDPRAAAATDFAIVTPGIRGGAAGGDERRSGTDDDARRTPSPPARQLSGGGTADHRRAGSARGRARRSRASLAARRQGPRVKR